MVTTFDPNKHHRRSIRLKSYDYTRPGAYFITIVAHRRKCLFGEITDRNMIVNAYGNIVWDEWMKSADIRGEIELDTFIVMPNHVHGIVEITQNAERPRRLNAAPLPDRRGDRRSPPPDGPRSKSLGAFIAGFKSAVTKSINELTGTPGAPIWQRNYYEHVIRDASEWNHLREYIAANPRQWETDRENPRNCADNR